MLNAAKNLKNIEEAVQEKRRENVEFDTKQMTNFLKETQSFLLRTVKKLDSASS